MEVGRSTGGLEGSAKPRSFLQPHLPRDLHTVTRKLAAARAEPDDWSSAVIDRQEEERRLREAKQMLDEMKRSDPGGDIKL